MLVLYICLALYNALCTYTYGCHSQVPADERRFQTVRWEEEEATRKWEQFLLPNHTCLQGDERGDCNGVVQLNIIIVKCACNK